ncbi:TIGR02234 family membrane protein [Streptomyces sp. NPDC088923]|uniref:TIGR02234 family membrane protein n=1 Tax=Streptomyces sp. NPDC088923 TaxID=3365913 RepID=UPI00381D7A50
MTAVPHPRTDAPPAPASPAAPAAARAQRGARRSLAAALVLGAAGAALALLCSRQTWAHGTANVVGGTLPLSVKGGDVTGAPAALAIVGLASLFAVFAVRRAGRVFVAALLALSGLGTVVAGVLGARDHGALDDKAAEASGHAAATVHAFSATAWPWVSTGAGALLLLAGVLALLHGRRWPAMSGRYERGSAAPRPRTPARALDPDRPEDLWKAIDRGEDPTGER